MKNLISQVILKDGIKSSSKVTQDEVLGLMDEISTTQTDLEKPFITYGDFANLFKK